MLQHLIKMINNDNNVSLWLAWGNTMHQMLTCSRDTPQVKYFGIYSIHSLLQKREKKHKLTRNPAGTKLRPWSNPRILEITLFIPRKSSATPTVRPDWQQGHKVRPFNMCCPIYGKRVYPGSLHQWGVQVWWCLNPRRASLPNSWLGGYSCDCIRRENRERGKGRMRGRKRGRERSNRDRGRSQQLWLCVCYY